MQIRAVLFGSGLLYASLVTARSQMSVQNAGRVEASARLVETDATPLRTGALTLEPRGWDVSMRSLAPDPFLLAAQTQSPASADGGALFGRASDGVLPWQASAAPWAALNSTGRSSSLIDQTDAKHVERNFELMFFGVAALVLSVLFLAVRAILRSQIFGKPGRSPRSAMARPRAGQAATGLPFKRKVSPCAQ